MVFITFNICLLTILSSTWGEGGNCVFLEISRPWQILNSHSFFFFLLLNWFLVPHPISSLAVLVSTVVYSFLDPNFKFQKECYGLVLQVQLSIPDSNSWVQGRVVWRGGVMWYKCGLLDPLSKVCGQILFGKDMGKSQFQRVWAEKEASNMSIICPHRVDDLKAPWQGKAIFCWLWAVFVH